MKKISEIPSLISDLLWSWRAIGQMNKSWASENYIDLISICDQMLRKRPNDYMAFYYRGLGNEFLNLYEDAISDYKQAAGILGKQKLNWFTRDYFSRIPIQLSRVYRKMQNNVKAFEYADKAIHIDQQKVDGLKWRASLKEENGDYIGAIEDLNEALKRRPKDRTLKKMRDRLTYIVINDSRETASR